MAVSSSDVVMLSRYPAHKIVVECDKCGMRAQYDKLGMLEAGGDRPLLDLLREIARRKGCEKIDNIDNYDRCRLIFANIAPARNEYAKAKGG